MTTTTAAIIDLENLLYDSRRAGSGEAPRDHLEWVWRYLSNRRDIRWSTAAADHWLTRIVLPVTDRIRLRVRPCGLGKNVADRALLQWGQDVPSALPEVLLVTGDRDLVPLVQAHQQLGRRVIVAAEPHKTSRPLIATADQYWPLASWSMIDPHALAA